ncbi:MAG: tRNA (adenosine(37)-N6)-dimethylallyltransferase MiaA [Coriobacteriales bacterium]
MCASAAQLPVIAVMGCTASGKSALADALALQLGGEVISADSMQVYRGMDIGTAKTPVDQRPVPYHCIDLVDPGQPYSAALFQRDSRTAIADIRSRGRVPVLCGGTFFYVRACLNSMDFAPGEQEGNPVRDRYNALAQELGAQGIWELLNRLDPESAAVVHPNNTVRVVRALEMHEAGESYAVRKEAFKGIGEAIPSIKIGLEWDTPRLYERINRRVDLMMEQGLVAEVESLLQQGFREGLTAPAAIGYKEVVAALDGACGMDEAVEQIKMATRRYSKRQRSWLRGEAGLVGLRAQDKPLEQLLDESLQLIAAAQQAVK